MEKKSYKTCPMCDCILLSERYKSHITEKHSPEEELKKIIIKQQINNIRQQKEINGEEIISCEKCGTEIKRKNLNKHNYNVHKKKKSPQL